jgi:hypothetical protein
VGAVDAGEVPASVRLRMVCQFKNTTMDQERERWRRIQAWKRLTGWQLEEKELQAYFESNRDRFSGENPEVRSSRCEPGRTSTS